MNLLRTRYLLEHNAYPTEEALYAAYNCTVLSGFDTIEDAVEFLELYHTVPDFIAFDIYGFEVSQSDLENAISAYMKEEK